MTSDPIVVENLRKVFVPFTAGNLRSFLSFRKRPPVVAIDDISLKVGWGRLLGLAGPNGSGKTTLIRILSGIIFADRGHVSINGNDIVRDGIRAKSAISVVFSENRNFYSRLTGRENLRIFAAFQNVSPRLVQRRIEEFSHIFKMQDFLDKSFQEYSLGMKQRQIGRAHV